SDAPAVSWSVSESGPADQPSVGERSVVIPSPSCSASHRESQPSPAHNMNTSAAEGCKVEPDAAPAAVLE
ncbi:hypothetical protein A2U01_0076688, partial [Trifolium medium]|nr:hypothetical protein [Trifolium medium]